MIQKTNNHKTIKKLGKRVLITLTSAFIAFNTLLPYTGTVIPSSFSSSVDGGTYSARLMDLGESTGFIPFTSYASTWPQVDFDVASDGAILIDADSNAILYEKNSTAAYFPASITKVLTAVLVLENCTNLEDKVTFSYAAVNSNLEPNSTIIGAVPGDNLSVRDCLYGLLLHSANDCANALAEYIAGSNEKFAEMMNAKAAELGCVNSHFVNPSGLNDPEHYTCAYDFAKIMQYAIKNDQFRSIDATQAYTHAPIAKYPNEDDSENTVYAHHHMMRRSYKEYYPGVFAGKTGYTTLAGNTLVTACERDGMTLICVILNGHSSQYIDTTNLFDFGFNNFKSLEADTNDPSLNKLKSNFKVDNIQLLDTLTFSIDPSYHITLPQSETMDSVTSTVSYSLSDVEKSNGAFARVDYSYGDKAVGMAYITLTETKARIDTKTKTTDASMSSDSIEETVPESISIDDVSSINNASSDGQSASDSGNHSPIIINKEDGRIEIPKPIKQLFMILGIIAFIALAIFGILYIFERREESIRTKRRERVLIHTRDLSRSQKIKRDILLSSRSRKKTKRK